MPEQARGVRRRAAGFVLATTVCALGLASAPAMAVTPHSGTTISPNLGCGAGQTRFVCLVAPTGGTPPYTQSWNGGPPTSSTTFNGPCGSLFIVTVTVTDSAGNTGMQRQAGLCGPL
jgi:hypothetical protein